HLLRDMTLERRGLLALFIVGTLLLPGRAQAQRKVDDVIFEGNEAFSSSRLKSIVRVDNASIMGVIRVKATFNYLVMARDVTYLRAFYRNRGYLQCTVEEHTESVGEDGLIVHFTIHEGPLTVLQRFGFEGNEFLSGEQLRDTLERLRGVRLREGDPINEAAIQAGAAAVLRHYRDSGHYFARVIPTVGRRDSTSGAAPIIYLIQEGPLVRVSDVRVEGTRTSKEFVVTREVTLGPGDLLTEEERRESQRRLYATGLFRTVSVTVGEVAPDSTSAVMLVTVNERPRRYVGTGFGLAGDREQQINLRLRTSAQWGHRNVYGTGRAVELSGNFDFRVVTAWEPVQSELGLRYLEPWFWGSRTPLTAYFGLRPQSYESYDVTELAAEIGLSKEFTPRFRSWINFSFRRVVTEEKIPLKAFTNRENLRGFNAAIERDGRDNILSPSRGSYLRVGLNGYGMLGLGGPHYRVFTLNWSRYKLTGLRTILAGRIRLGLANPGGNMDEVPIFDRFFTGGASSIRGYNERQLGPVNTFVDTISGETTYRPRGGQALALLNIEMRRPGHFGPFGLILFIDAGNVWETVGEMGRNPDLAFSAGLGLFLDTPIGPVQIGYGWRLNLSPTEKKYADYQLKPGRLYLTVQYAF
ncbi:MAG: BamA/TamA family outer membrane protein, partial [Candidatus Latescibacteria bacterium]|nr:BamA/TamA family outer membrane protein [Candidatus Latescibacterota bacterium]